MSGSKCSILEGPKYSSGAEKSREKRMVKERLEKWAGKSMQSLVSHGEEFSCHFKSNGQSLKCQK